MQDPKQDVNVDEVLLTKPVPVLKVYMTAYNMILLSLSYWMKTQDVVCFADTTKRQTLESEQTIYLWWLKSRYKIIIS